MDLEAQLKDNGYRNWVRSALALNYLKEGLEGFVDQQAKLLHTSLVSTSTTRRIHCSKCECTKILIHDGRNCIQSPATHTPDTQVSACVGCYAFECDCSMCGVSFCFMCRKISSACTFPKCSECKLVSCKFCKGEYCVCCGESKTKCAHGTMKCNDCSVDHCVDRTSVHSGKCNMESCNKCLEKHCKQCSRLNCSMCKCDIKSILPDHKSSKCVTKGQKCNCRVKNCKACINNECGELYDRIVNDHVKHMPIWSNTDPAQWSSSYWEIAKCFLSCSGYEDRCAASDTDASGLLSICINSMCVQKSIDNIEAFKTAREYRNKILHSSSMIVADADVTKYIEQMILVLEDGIVLKGDAAASDAVLRLKEIQENKIELNAKLYNDARYDALNAVEFTMKEIKTEITEETIDSTLIYDLKNKIENLDAIAKKHRDEMKKYILAVRDDTHNEIRQEIYAAESRSKQHADDRIDEVNARIDDRRDKDNARMKRIEECLIAFRQLHMNNADAPVVIGAVIKLHAEEGTVTNEEEQDICSHMVEITNSYVQDEYAGSGWCIVAHALKKVFDCMARGFQNVQEARQECVAFQVECQNIGALANLIEDCISGKMTCLFKPVQDEIRKLPGFHNVVIDISMTDKEIWRCFQTVETKLHGIYLRDCKEPLPELIEPACAMVRNSFFKRFDVGVYGIYVETTTDFIDRATTLMYTELTAMIRHLRGRMHRPDIKFCVQMVAVDDVYNKGESEDGSDSDLPEDDNTSQDGSEV